MIRRIRGAIVLYLLLAFSVVLLASPQALAFEEETSASVGEAGAEGVPIEISVSYTTASGAPVTGHGAATTVVATVPPVCGFSPGMTGEQMAQWLESGGIAATASTVGESIEDWKAQYPDYGSHREDAQGRWYSPMCWRHNAGSMDAETFDAMQREHYEANGPVFVPAGQAAPAPTIDGRTLAEAAWEAVVVPVPAIDHNPSLGASGATLVGFETWVWATDTPAHVTATATAGPVTATVTATAGGLELSGPDAQADCTGFGIPWSQGATTDCSVVFTRSSAHLGGVTPLTVSASYSASFTSTDGATGSLGTITTSTTISIPVAEAQVLNRDPATPPGTHVP